MARAKKALAQPAVRPAAKPARRALPELDRVLHERMRLAIVSSLAANASLTFLEQRSLLNASDANL